MMNKPQNYQIVKTLCSYNAETYCHSVWRTGGQTTQM